MTSVKSAPTLASDVDGRVQPAVQPPIGRTSIGMYYDLDAALLAAFKTDDRHFSLRCNRGRSFQATIELLRPIRTLERLNRMFFDFWGRVGFATSYVERDLLDDEVVYRFKTGDGGRRYSGSVTFTGAPIRDLLRRRWEGPSLSRSGE